MWSRRAWIIQAGLLPAVAGLTPSPVRASPYRAATWAAAWDDAAGRHWIGVLREGAAGTPRLVVQARIEVPTRAHAVRALPDGELIAVARRPGAWLLRWQPGAPQARWHWCPADRSFNGHAVVQDGAIWCTETEHAEGQGQWVQRDLDSLEILRIHPSGGIDPHALLPLSGGRWLVANGGVPTHAETGRARQDLDRMDSSLALFNAQGGVLGTWRLTDPRLSLRHLAQHPDGRVGVALQAEHDDAPTRRQAPLLAIWDGNSLQLGVNPPLEGYAGDILAHPGGFVLAATRADCVVTFDLQGRCLRRDPSIRACALASWGDQGWIAGGSEGGIRSAPPAARPQALALPGLRIDNHWTMRLA